jgi:anti-sigma factor RsiW
MGEFRQKIKRYFIRLLWRLTPDCKDITALLSQSLDRRLSARERIETKLHLYSCQACSRYISQIQFVRDAFRELENETDAGKSKAVLSDEARDRIKAAIKTTGGKL